MQASIQCGPSFSMLDVELGQGEKIIAEGGSMTWMQNVNMTTNMTGGIMSGLKRAVTGESMFLNTFEGDAGGGTVTLSPGEAGDITRCDVEGQLYLQKGAFLCCGEGVETGVKFDGLKGFLNVGLLALEVHGRGPVWISSYGAIEEIDVDGEYIVDNGFVVGWQPSLNYSVYLQRSVRTFLFNVGFLLKFTGAGKLWVQSRNPLQLADWVYPFRPVKKKD
ncbi:MAG: TIGR00266 family protein [Pirellulaceae bacterium]